MLAHEGRHLEIAGEIIGPGVVGTDDLSDMAGTRKQLGGTVAAGIDQGLDRSVGLTHDQHRRLDQAMGQVIARLGNFIGPPNTDPVPGKQLLNLQRRERGIRIGTRRQRGCLLERQRRRAADLGKEGGKVRHDSGSRVAPIVA